MKYDVVVVGAGPAGSTAAKYLAEKGVKVLLIDKKKFPRNKQCGGGLTTRTIERFPYIENLVESISYGSITYSSSLKHKLEIQRDKPLIATVLRKDFDNALVKIAVEKGATFLSEKTVVDIQFLPDKVLVILEEGKKIECQVVIGCEGMRSIVADKTNLCKEKNNVCVCILQESKMSAEQLDKYFTKNRTVHLFLKVQGIAGYGWIFPKKKHINLGLGEFEPAIDKSRDKVNLKEVYQKYIESLKKNKILPKDFKIDDLKGGTLPIFPLEKTYSDRVILCGDAAGFVNPITGEGIYYAMVSGEIAAEVISSALKTGDTSEKFLSEYQQIWKKDFGADIELLGRFNTQWGKNSEKIIRLLTRDKRFAKIVIGITGGQISFSKYKLALMILYVYASLKDLFKRK